MLRIVNLQVFSEENKIGLLYETDNLAKAGVIDVSIYQGFAKSLTNHTLATRRAVLRSASYSAKMATGRHHTIQRRSNSSPVQVIGSKDFTLRQMVVHKRYGNLGASLHNQHFRKA